MRGGGSSRWASGISSPWEATNLAKGLYRRGKGYEGGKSKKRCRRIVFEKGFKEGRMKRD